MLKILNITAKQRCTGFFCMDERFFNHLGPFYQTTPPISNEEKITERSIFASNTKAIDTGIILLMDQVAVVLFVK